MAWRSCSASTATAPSRSRTTGAAHSGCRSPARRCSAALQSTGAYLVGRRLHDHTHGWEGRPPLAAPMVVVTHEPPADPPRGGVPITFACDGIEAAVADAAALAGDRVVAVAGGALARECLDAGLLDEISVNLVPVVLGAGIPFLAGLRNGPVRLEDPGVTEAPGVTNLRYRVRRPPA